MIARSDIRWLHRRAMLIADCAYGAQRDGDERRAARLFARAHEYERRAAENLEASDNCEPTRSILYRSAAALDVKAGLHALAELMARRGLSGNPPAEIAAELCAIGEKSSTLIGMALGGRHYTTAIRLARGADWRVIGG